MIEKIVVDTSVAVKWFGSLEEKDFEKANLFLKKAVEGKIEVLALDLIYYELANALFWGKKLSLRKTIDAMELFSEIPMTIFAYEASLFQTAVGLMKGRKLAFYDAVFAALARREGCSLLSADRKHHGELGNVLLLEDFR